MATDEQQQRNQASMSLLEKMAELVDELLEEREEKQRLEREWQSRLQTPPTPDEETPAD